MAIHVSYLSPAELLESVGSVVYNANLRASQAGAEASLAAEDYVHLIEAWDKRCAYCNHALVTVLLEHMLPIARGGSSALDNVAPSCDSCNVRKGNQTPVEWLSPSRYGEFEARLETSRVRYSLLAGGYPVAVSIQYSVGY